MYTYEIPLQVNITGNINSDNDLVPPGKKPITEPEVYPDLCHNLVKLLVLMTWISNQPRVNNVDQSRNW